MKHLLFVFFSVALLGFFVSIGPQLGWAHPSIDIVASNWKFTPGTITIPAGEPTTLRLTSSEGVHGIASKDLNIPDTTIVPNKFVTVTFTPSKAGTYVVHCSVVCGAGHPNMALTIKVQK
jgi:cytochrome c oxidase subunit II